jgi:hypothetical protein
MAPAWVSSPPGAGTWDPSHHCVATSSRCSGRGGTSWRLLGLTGHLASRPDEPSTRFPLSTSPLAAPFIPGSFPGTEAARGVGQFSTPITPLGGSLLHAD